MSIQDRYNFTGKTYTGWSDPALQEDIAALVEFSGHAGVTTKELRAFFPLEHHGVLSGGTSLLHGANKIARLADKRDGYKIYVGLPYIDNRPCEAQGWANKRLSPKDQSILDQLLEGLDYWLQVDEEGARFKTDKTKAERHQRLFFNDLKRLHREWTER